MTALYLAVGILLVMQSEAKHLNKMSLSLRPFAVLWVTIILLKLPSLCILKINELKRKTHSETPRTGKGGYPWLVVKITQQRYIDA